MNSTTDAFTAARAAALFVSDVSVADHLTDTELDAAIRRSLRTHGGSRGCAADLAAAYGDRPELGASRMRWALGVVNSRYGRPAARVTHRGAAPVRIDRVPAPADRQLVAA
jgi:hypothetical protein